ncbi:MAG: hypothetical protein M3066_01675 [Actinomycetota bacterium]|nr:hypothetical protein [Actinomycetota bacterium]
MDWIPAALGSALVHIGPGGRSAWTATAAGGLGAYVVGLAAIGTRFVVSGDVT